MVAQNSFYDAENLSEIPMGSPQTEATNIRRVEKFATLNRNSLCLENGTRTT